MESAEKLHDIGKGLTKNPEVKSGFINPGTPKEALVQKSEMTSATLRDSKNAKLMDGLVK